MQCEGNAVLLDPAPAPSVARSPLLRPGLHLEGWRGPNGEYVVVPIGDNGRIAVPAPIYVSSPAELLQVRADFDRGALPGQTWSPSLPHDVANF